MELSGRNTAGVELELELEETTGGRTKKNKRLMWTWRRAPASNAGELEEEATAATKTEKLRLLMWKNFLQQRRHMLQTAVEVLLPVLTVSLVVILRTRVTPTAHSSVLYPPLPAYSLNNSLPVLKGMDVSKVSIAFSPRSPVLERIVRAAAVNIVAQNSGFIGLLFIKKLLPRGFQHITKYLGNWDRSVELPDEVVNVLGRFVNVTPYNKSAQMHGIYLKSDAARQILAAVQFDDTLIDATKLPDEINYKLRFPRQPRLSMFYALGGFAWKTDHMFPDAPALGPRFPYSFEGGNDPGYVNEMFILLQQAISLELIKVKAEKNPGLRVNIRRFPHPPYTDDQLVEILQIILPLLIVTSFTYTAVSTVRVITRENELQLKESMKIMGLPIWLHWTAWFLKQFVFQIVSVFLVVVILKSSWCDTATATATATAQPYGVLRLTPCSVVFAFMTLYIVCTILFCFMVSGLFRKASTASLFCAVFWFVIYVPGLFLTMDSNASFMGKVISCFSVNSAMALGFQLILKAEAANKGLEWGAMLTPSSSDNELLFGHVLLMLAVDSWLYAAFALYVEQVTAAGITQPWYFLFQLSYWFPKMHLPKVREFKREVYNCTNSIRESDPVGLRVGVEIQNLTKAFNKHVAVNRLSISIFEDQITVLLGHNGAGKSTTISMLTGLISPTRGTAIMAGHNILTHLKEARSSLGICPQHNVLFADLTVREHLQFFSRLKGFKGEKLKQDVENLIVKLELEVKADTQAGALSGGQQRRLCVGVALCGAPRVVLLDEPTSGMDPSSRRALWDLLQREKKDRAMILTTHFMDEADILGDRIVIMAEGRLQCVGSPFFLKHQFGNGYKLIIVKGENCNVLACTKFLERDLSNVKTLSSRGSEIVYSLPTTCGVTLQKKLEDLEANQTILGVKSYGLVPTTLEDVFMKIGADSEKSLTEDQNGIQLKQLSLDEPEHVESATTDNIPSLLNWRERGLRLLGNHMLAVLMKRGLVTMRAWRLTLLQVLVPVIIVVLPVFSVQYASVPSETVIPRELSLTRGYINTKTILEYDKAMKDTSSSMLALKAFRNHFMNTGSSIVETGNSSVEDFYLNQAVEPTSMARMRYESIIGATFTPTCVTAWFSNFGYHDVAVSLATVHNALLQAHAPNASILVTNYPLPSISSNEVDRQKLHKLLAMQLSIAVSTSIAIVTSFFVVFYIKERVSRAKLMQNSSGIRPIVLWGMASVFDWLWFMVVCLAVILTLAALRVDGFSSVHDLGRGYVVFMVFGASVLPLQYLASFLFSGAASGFVLMYFFHIFFGTICSVIVQILSLTDSTTLGSTLDLILQFLPTYSLSMCFRHLNTIGLRESLCQQACSVWTNIMGVNNCTMHTACSHQLLGDLCCVESNPHFLWKAPGIARNLNCMLTTGAVLWTILMIIEYRVFNELAWWKQRNPPPLKTSAEDEDVEIEAERVRQVDEFNLYDYNLLCRDITKYYGHHLAVNQVSFGVKSKECFGLLGINGAGKTTTFKMLTGDIPMSNGDAYVRGHSITNNIKRVQENIGYCPQFDALFEELTGRETLRLYALLRGLRTEHASSLTIDLARRLNFLKHIDKQVGHYSGGNKRKLSTALALMGYASVVYLDEPTTGVDPAAKRQVWRAINHSTEAGRSVVLTSHSMEECEALCTRLAIMVNGRFQCFGSPQHLKNKFSQGYILTAKLKQNDVNDTNERATSYIEQHLSGAKLVESYQGLVTYYLPPEQNAVMSRIFGLMETAKGQQQLVEDYIVSQTTLEQVFLQFTRFQKDST